MIKIHDTKQLYRQHFLDKRSLCCTGASNRWWWTFI